MSALVVYLGFIFIWVIFLSLAGFAIGCLRGLLGCDDE